MKRLPISVFILLSFLLIHAQLSAQLPARWFEKQDPVQFRKLYLHTDRENYFQGDSIWFRAYYLDGQTQEFVPGIFTMYSDLTDQNGTTIQHQAYPVEYGMAVGKMVLPDSLKPGNYVLRAFTDFQKQFGEDAFYHKVLNISKVKRVSDGAIKPSDKPQPAMDVAFLPEGGIFLAGQSNVVGIKAIDETGRGIRIEGVIEDSNEEEVASFDTDYQGMDILQMIPHAGEVYKMKIRDHPEYIQEIAQVQPEGIKLELKREAGEELWFQATANSEAFTGENYLFVIMHHGNVIFHQQFEQKGDEFSIRVKRDALPAGINRFILMDEKLVPISERLYFSKEFYVNKLNLIPDKKRYSTRSLVNMELVDEPEFDGAAFSSVSVAVVDEFSIGERGPEMNLLSWLLLDSEIRGPLESTADYFVDGEKMSSIEKLNLLMLTQGWSRYLWNTIPERAALPEKIENQGIILTGSVLHPVTKNPVINGSVDLNIYSNDYFVSREGKSDKDGRFFFDRLFFEDTAAVVVQARNKKNKPYTIVSLDPVFEMNPGVAEPYLPPRIEYTDFPVSLYQKQYFNELELRDYLLKTGSILLEEVTIVTQKREVDDGHFRMYPKPVNSLKVTPRDASYRNVGDYLQGRVSGVVVVGESIRIRGIGSFSPSPPLFLVDGTPMPGEVVMNLPMADIDVVEVLKNPHEAGIFGVNAGNGVISVFTKRGGQSGDTYLQGTIADKIAGYDSYREFYVPLYTSENIDSEKPDHRITLYWNPDIRTEKGRATVSFFTSDDLSRYRVFVEGITQTGEVCLGSTEFEVTTDPTDPPD